MNSRIIPFENLQNMRDMGGIAAWDGRIVRSGMLFRSGRPADGTLSDLEKLSGMGIGRIIDLRTEQEASEKPDPPVPGAEMFLIQVSSDPVTGQAVGDRGGLRVRERMELMYRDIILGEASSRAMARVIRCMEENDTGACLFHCTAGKDRTGIIGALIYEMLGASREDIISDYMLTGECLSAFADRLYARIGARRPPDVPEDVYREDFYDSMLVREEYILAMYDAIGERYSSVADYLRYALGFDDGFVMRFRQKFLES